MRSLVFQKPASLASTNHVPLNHRKFNLEGNTVFWVIATEILSVPAGHNMSWPARIQEWKRPLSGIPALIEPEARINTLKTLWLPESFSNSQNKMHRSQLKKSGWSNHGVWKHNIGYLWNFSKTSVEPHSFHITKIGNQRNWRVLRPTSCHRLNQSGNIGQIAAGDRWTCEKNLGSFHRRINGSSAIAMTEATRLMSTQVQSQLNHRIEHCIYTTSKT